MCAVAAGPDQDATAKRIQWRCRRGIRELDLVFARFLERGIDALPPAERETFERLLDESDLDIYDWVTGRVEAPNEDYRRLVARLAAGAR